MWEITKLKIYLISPERGIIRKSAEPKYNLSRKRIRGGLDLFF